jgi:hypothetical protein
VLGTALAIKMSAYILVAPVAAAFADKFPRRTMLVTLDLVRARGYHAAVRHPDMGNLHPDLHSSGCLGGVTPTFQATIPDILPDEREYTRALFCHVWPTILKASSAYAGGCTADGHEFPQPVCRYGSRVPCFCSSGCFRDTAEDESVNGQTQHL